MDPRKGSSEFGLNQNQNLCELLLKVRALRCYAKETTDKHNLFFCSGVVCAQMCEDLLKLLIPKKGFIDYHDCALWVN